MSSLSHLLRSLGVAAILTIPMPALAQVAGDHIDITAVAVEGANPQECAARTDRLSEQSRALSLATSPPGAAPNSTGQAA